jgi:hypothetical protein
MYQMREESGSKKGHDNQDHRNIRQTDRVIAATLTFQISDQNHRGV